MKVFSIISIFIIFLFTVVSSAETLYSHKDVPDDIDKSKKYLFYLHDKFVEKKGPSEVHKKYGRNEYVNKLKAFSDNGLIVISEKRPRVKKYGKKGKPFTEYELKSIQKYAEKVAGQVRKLMSAGIPPENIFVVGYSRGASITMRSSTILREPNINYVVLAECGYGIHYDQVIRPYASQYTGRFLSLYDADDKQTGSCKKTFEMAQGDLKYDEFKLNTHLGHGLFFKPRKVWMDIVLEWINKKK